MLVKKVMSIIDHVIAVVGVVVDVCPESISMAAKSEVLLELWKFLLVCCRDLKVL